MRYDIVPYDQIKNGDMVVAYGVHPLEWEKSWGNPGLAIVPANDINEITTLCDDIATLRKENERLRELLSDSATAIEYTLMRDNKEDREWAYGMIGKIMIALKGGRDV